MSLYLDIEPATRILEAIQRENKTQVSRYIRNDKVSIMPLSGNAFRVTGPDASDPTRQRSYKFLNSIGADIKTEPVNDILQHYIATLTWDSMLHYVVRPGALLDKYLPALDE